MSGRSFASGRLSVQVVSYMRLARSPSRSVASGRLAVQAAQCLDAATAMLAANCRYRWAALLPAAHTIGGGLGGRRHRRVGSRQSSGGLWSLAANGNRAADCGMTQKRYHFCSAKLVLCSNFQFCSARCCFLFSKKLFLFSKIIFCSANWFLFSKLFSKYLLGIFPVQQLFSVLRFLFSKEQNLVQRIYVLFSKEI